MVQRHLQGQKLSFSPLTETVPSTGLPRLQSALRPGVEEVPQLPRAAGATIAAPHPAFQVSAPEARILDLITHMCLPGLAFRLEETHHFHLCLSASWPGRTF